MFKTQVEVKMERKKKFTEKPFWKVFLRDLKGGAGRVVQQVVQLHSASQITHIIGVQPVSRCSNKLYVDSHIGFCESLYSVWNEMKCAACVDCDRNAARDRSLSVDVRKVWTTASRLLAD